MTQQTTDLAELPQGWVWTTLGEMGEYINGRAFKPSEWEEFGRPILRIQNLTGSTDDVNRYSKPIEDKYIVRDGDLLISWSATLGGYVYRGEEAVLNQHIFKVQPHVDKLFLYYLVNASLQSLKSQIHGTGMQHITKSKFDDSPVPLPSLLEQHRIVAKIEELFTKLDAGVDALSKIKAQLKRYRQAVLKYAFEGKLTAEWRRTYQHELEPASVLLERIKQERHKTAKGKYNELPPLEISTPPELPEGWMRVRLGDLFNISYGLAEPLSKIEPDDEFDVPVIRIANVTEFGSLDLTTMKYYPVEKEKRQKLLLSKDDVLFNWRNAPKWIGKSAVFDKEGEFVNASFLLKLRPYLHGYSSFVTHYINHLRINGYFLTRVANAVNQANFNASMTAQVEVIIPPLLEQQEIVRDIEFCFSIADQIEKTVDHSLKQAERLRQSILKKAFEGKLVPQDPNDEPAEKLLERINAERAKHLAEAKTSSKSKKKIHTKQMRFV